MYSPPLSEYFWPPATATPGSAPWPLLLWFDTSLPPDAYSADAGTVSVTAPSARVGAVTTTPREVRIGTTPAAARLWRLG